MYKDLRIIFATSEWAKYYNPSKKHRRRNDKYKDIKPYKNN